MMMLIKDEAIEGFLSRITHSTSSRDSLKLGVALRDDAAIVVKFSSYNSSSPFVMRTNSKLLRRRSGYDEMASMHLIEIGPIYFLMMDSTSFAQIDLLRTIFLFWTASRIIMIVV